MLQRADQALHLQSRRQKYRYVPCLNQVLPLFLYNPTKSKVIMMKSTVYNPKEIEERYYRIWKRTL